MVASSSLNIPNISRSPPPARRALVPCPHFRGGEEAAADHFVLYDGVKRFLCAAVTYLI